MENDSEEKIIQKWNTDYPDKAQKSFNGAYRMLKQFASGIGKQSRIKGYNYVDQQNKAYKTIVELQQNNRKTGVKSLLELWARAKRLKKLRKQK